MEQNLVIVVDVNDTAIGTMEKLKAHRRAVLHRAVSVLIFNTSGDWLLQQRAKKKYHSNSLWTNTCCSHPHPGESNLLAANRRLVEEMGIKCNLEELFWFTYKVSLDNNLTEHELDHVFIGISDDPPNINTDEVMDFRYISPTELKSELKDNPENFTDWFRKIVHQLEIHLPGRL